MKIKGLTKYFSVHYSFIILLIAAFFAGLGNLVLMYFISLVLHELVHAMVAKKLGYKIGKIKLLATGAVLEAESDEFSFTDEIKISLSAPLFNLFCAILLLSFWWIIPESYNWTQDLLVINLAIFGFNILPIFPLDGGRVLLAFLSRHLERKNAVSITKAVAIIFSLIIFALFIFSLFIQPNFSIGVASVTLFIGAIAEDKAAAYKKVLFLERKIQRTKKNGVEVKYLMVNQAYDEKKLIKLINARFFTVFVFVDDCFKVVKIKSENEIFGE